MSDISDRIREICAQKGTSMYKLEKQLNIGNGTIGKWGKNGRQPTYDKVSAVADALGVSIDYLLTGEQKEKPVSDGDRLDANTKELLDIWNSEDEAGKKALIEMARFIKSKREK